MSAAIAVTDYDWAEVEVLECLGCAVTYLGRDGYAGICATCLAVIDDHRSGRHDDRPAECRLCW